ncbi:restriction endonuclease subunit S [Paenibacillus sp. FSL P2-0089]|uniref:restriction endonuclease subunit S n=1 Tax=Paenibacillus sp. FSL P2-0089 TaxID=2954526 RepID=UPI00315B26A8
MSKWEQVKLGDIGKIVTGTTPSTKNIEYYNANDIPFYKPNDLSETKVSYLIEATNYLSELAKTKLRILPKGSVLVTCIGTIGKIGVALIECSCNQQINAIIPNLKKIDSQYLAYSLFNMRKYMQGIANAAIVPILNKSNFSNIEIIIPPLQTQKQIAKTLDTAAELLAMRKQQLVELDNLIKATFYDMFSDPSTNLRRWNQSTVGKTIEVIEAGWSTDGEKRKKREDEKAVLKVSAVTSGYFRGSEYKVLDKDLEIKKYVYPHKGDLLFSRANTRELVGATCMIFDDYPDLLLPDKLWRIKFNNLADLFYMKYTLSDSSVRNSLSNVSTGTSGSMYNVSMDKLKSLIVPLPPIELQTQFANIVTKIEEQKAIVKQAIDETQHLFDSLMSEYFE